TLCEFFHSELVEDEASLRNIERIFKGRGYPLTPTNRLQAWVPACCKVIVNEVGTAPCMWFEHQGKIIVSMPGVPSEMKFLMEKSIIPSLQERNADHCIVMRNLLVQGIGESFLSDMLEPWETSLPSHFSLAYLPQHGMLRLRLTAQGNDRTLLESQMEKKVASVYQLAGKYIVGEEQENLQAIAADWLLRLGKSLSTAESCTGGGIASRITAMPGASAYYKGGVVAYSNELKEKLLGVSHETLADHGAVSEETVREMAEGIRKISGSDYAIATTGIAGPGGGTAEKPVGTVWIGIASAEKTVTKLLHLSDQRANVIERTCNQVFSELIQILRASCGK
ncbi:MAG: CinA family nicotinamide mononucleotide deamidase-related protein, partial [Bacteroidales bacterium]|nr:CinA family nicotinamide mononucleotide deamidase-related protein [Bacteroidales bacterium]